MKLLMYKELRDNFRSDKKRIQIFRKIWRRKAVLRRIYFDKWSKMMSYADKKGKVLEIGSGPGMFKQFCPRAVLLDVIKNPWIDVVGDGVHLPFRKSSIETIIFVDVLHHVRDPIAFLKEAQRVLKPGGRIIFEEPYVSKFSYWVYRFHHEGLDSNCDKKNYQLDTSKKALEADLAIPTIMFGRDFKRVMRLVPGFKLIKKEKGDYFLHLLFGNFSYHQFLPSFMYRPLQLVEKKTKFFDNILSFKILIVMEKRNK